MICDRCLEQLPVGDGLGHQWQPLCLVCYLRSAASSKPSSVLQCLDLTGADDEQAVQVSIIDTDLLIAQNFIDNATRDDPLSLSFILCLPGN